MSDVINSTKEAGADCVFLHCRYKAMEACVKKGKTKAVGVSNFSKAEMEKLVKSVDTVSIDSDRSCAKD